MVAKSRISLRGLRTFCVAARYESFRIAGDELFITPSAVSHQIKSLEDELGERLFDRSTRELSLTEVGRSLYQELAPLIDQMDVVVARYMEGSASSSIRISVQPFFASEYFVPRLQEFTAEHPHIDIQVGTSDETAEKHPSDADLSIRLFRTAPADLPSTRLFPYRMLPASSPEFKKSIRLKKQQIVSDFPLIVHETYPRAWAHWSAESGIKLPENSRLIRLDSMIAVVRAAQRGIGAALVPVPIGRLWFEEGSIVQLFDQELISDASYYLVCKADRADDRNVRLLRDWIEKNFKDPA